MKDFLIDLVEMILTVVFGMGATFGLFLSVTGWVFGLPEGVTPLDQVLVTAWAVVSLLMIIFIIKPDPAEMFRQVCRKWGGRI